MNPEFSARVALWRPSDLGLSAPRLAALVFALSLVGCGSLKPQASPEAPAHYALAPTAVAAPTGPSSRAVPAPTLVVAAPRAAAGFDSPHIVYVRRPPQVEHFARNEWVDTPARMLAPWVVSSLEASGVFRAVVIAGSSATGELRLDTEILRLQHEFMEAPSRVRFGLRATLVREATREVIATRAFEAVVEAARDDPGAGVVAAGEAVRQVLEQLVAFCASTGTSAPARP